MMNSNNIDELLAEARRHEYALSIALKLGDDRVTIVAAERLVHALRRTMACLDKSPEVGSVMSPAEIRAAIRTARRLGLEGTPLVALAALVTRYLRLLDRSEPVVGEIDQSLAALRVAVDCRRPPLTQALEQALRDIGQSHEPSATGMEGVWAGIAMTRWQRLRRWLRGGRRAAR
jgi:hypothetical protein